MDSIKMVALAKKHNGSFKGRSTHDHDGTPVPVLVFLWDDEDDSDAFMEALPRGTISRVTHEHNERGVLESRVALAGL